MLKDIEDLTIAVHYDSLNTDAHGSLLYSTTLTKNNQNLQKKEIVIFLCI